MPEGGLCASCGTECGARGVCSDCRYQSQTWLNCGAREKDVQTVAERHAHSMMPERLSYV